MKKLILTIVAVSTMAVLNADEPKSLIAAINATYDAQQTLIKDLENDEGNVRSEYTGCPSEEQLAKILQDERRYNAAAKVWLREMK